jgi:hypothetical protein
MSIRTKVVGNLITDWDSTFRPCLQFALSVADRHERDCRCGDKYSPSPDKRSIAATDAYQRRRLVITPSPMRVCDLPQPSRQRVDRSCLQVRTCGKLLVGQKARA